MSRGYDYNNSHNYRNSNNEACEYHQRGEHDYYNRPLDDRGGCRPKPPCPPPINPDIAPAPAFAQMIAEHNNDKAAHPYLLSLFRSSINTYCCKSTITERDAIEEETRVLGLMAYVSSTDKVYRLEGGITNDNWKELNINSKNYIKLGRHNAPLDPEHGVLYFNLTEEKFYVYLNDEWEALPSFKDMKQIVQEHNVDPLAHQEKFMDAENKWFTI